MLTASSMCVCQMAYNQAMASCSWEQAWSCMQAMRLAGVQPSTRSYNAVRGPAAHCSDTQRPLFNTPRLAGPSKWCW